MCWKLALVTMAAVLVQQDIVSAQSSQIPSTTTAAELWNPYTWFWPYAIASAESYRDYFEKAQKATNELYQQAYSTNAFPWITGNSGGAPKPQDNSNQNGQGNNPSQNNQGQNNGSNNQGGSPNQGNQGQNSGDKNQGQKPDDSNQGQQNSGNNNQEQKPADNQAQNGGDASQQQNPGQAPAGGN